MMHLAFDQHGQPIEPPAEAMGWRVRKMQPGRGAPTMVYGDLGTPLIIPIDAEAPDFRKYVTESGRYKLEPITEDYKVCSGTVAGYVQLRGTEQTAESAEVGGGTSYELVHEMMKSNIALATSIAAGQAELVTASAALVKAADGAGLSAREPLNLLSTIEQMRNAFAPDGEESDEAVAVSPAAPASNAGFQEMMAMKLANELLPNLQYLMQTKWMGMSPEQAAAMTGVGPSAQNTNAAPPATETNDEPAPTTSDEPDSEDDSTPAPAPLSQAERMQRMLEVEAQLSPRERKVVYEAVMGMDDAERERWTQHLGSIPLDEAVALVRSEVMGAAA